jgi:hypothetical protein
VYSQGVLYDDMCTNGEMDDDTCINRENWMMTRVLTRSTG